jgi:hypothetical protein
MDTYGNPIRFPQDFQSVAGDYTLLATKDGNNHVTGWAFSGANPHGGTISMTLDLIGQVTITIDDSGGTGWTGYLKTFQFENFDPSHNNDQSLTPYPLPDNTGVMRDSKPGLAAPGWIEGYIGIAVGPGE